MKYMIILLVFILPFLIFEFNETYSIDLNPFYVIDSESMSPVLHIGDMVMVCNNNSNGTSFDNIRIGDIIVFNAFAPDPVEEGKTIVSRVAAIFEEGETLRGNAELNQLCYPVSVPAVLENKTILTKGDANECSIPGVDIPITQENYIGRVVSIINDQHTPVQTADKLSKTC